MYKFVHGIKFLSIKPEVNLLTNLCADISKSYVMKYSTTRNNKNSLRAAILNSVALQTTMEVIYI